MLKLLTTKSACLTTIPLTDKTAVKKVCQLGMVIHLLHLGHIINKKKLDTTSVLLYNYFPHHGNLNLWAQLVLFSIIISNNHGNLL